MDITGARALVTGGGGGLGRHISLALARAGADVAVTYLSRSGEAEKLCAEVEALGRRVMAVRMDITDAAAIEAAVGAVAGAWGGLDILVNNAGRGRPTLPGEDRPREVAHGDIAALTPELYDLLMAINMRGPFLAARAAAPWLRASGRGRIVNIGSTIGFSPRDAGLSFAMAKAGAVPLTRYLATTLAPEVLVNCVAPGLIEGTGLTGAASQAYIESWRDKAILARTTAPEDVAAQVLALVQSTSTTGQTVVVDGGISFN
ncbi:SDR family NAD(P)-dependent oxidoreductase [Seohaeicola zhoushanensis]|uniref:Beta-ketoacyl-ACP reductase n=1 Tax=Seohaeicola zhoushanensis TaxID=1569283 RepID=A0A8J3M3M4_9RHOB|nr:SDR family oxidoreductase [Seohaeicola zhoushanensis]GHF34279.1 beta-ketoacyl-ACP reductase [Seohaeicola zhoushanensis]